MTDLQENVQKLYESRLKAQTELNSLQQKIFDSIANADRRVKLERLVKEAEDSMTRAFSKNEQVFALASKTTNAEALKAYLEQWLKMVTELNDEILRKAREYIDACPAADEKSHSSVGTVNKKASKRSSISTKSKTSSQKQKELVLAIQRREELARQSENALRLAKQRHEFARKRLEEEQALQLEEMAEESRRKLAEARITELELTENLSQAPDECHETLSRLSKHSRQTASQRVSDWVNDVNSEPPQAVTTDANALAESSNPPVASTTPTTEVVQSGYPNQLAALVSGLSTFTPEQPLNVAAVNFSLPVITNSSRPSLAAVSHLPFRHVPSAAAPTTSTTVPPISQTPNSPSQTQQPVISITTQPQLTIPSSHAVPNLSAWTFPVGNSLPMTQYTAPPPTGRQFTSSGTAIARIMTTTGYSVPVVSIQSGGTTYYCNPQGVTVPTAFVPITQPTTTLIPASTFPNFQHPIVPPRTPTTVTVNDLAQLFSAAKKDHLPEWKLSQYNGDPLQWHEWIGHFRSEIDSAPLSNDVKLTYLKTLVTGKAKTAIAEFAYCGTMYQDALKTLERKFGQPQAAVSAHLDKLISFPPLKIHNSDKLIAFSATIFVMVGVFRSLKYEHDLSSAAFFLSSCAETSS